MIAKGLMAGKNQSKKYKGVILYLFQRRQDITFSFRRGDRHIKVGRQSEGYTEEDAFVAKMFDGCGIEFFCHFNPEDVEMYINK